MPNRLALPVLNPAWSLMRCVFALEICLVHLVSPVWNQLEEGWIADTVFMSVARTGTIGFIMLAGAILIGRGPGSVGQYLGDRLRRWLPLLVMAQLLYLALTLWIERRSLGSLGWSDLLEPAWYHMWFFYALGPIYAVVVPMRWYAAWADGLGGTARMVALWAPVAGLFAGSAWITAVYGLWGDLRPINVLIYCGFAWTGHVLATTFPNGVSWASRLMLLGVGGAALVSVLVIEAAGEPVSAYFHRCSIFVALAASGQFLLLLRAGQASWSSVTTRRMHAVARLTLGIFVIHPLLIVLAGWPPAWATAGWHKWLSMPAAAVGLFVLSGVVTWLWLQGTATLQRALVRERSVRHS
jgi:surface polysaccharide O-acyltransferase-like enzyme